MKKVETEKYEGYTIEVYEQEPNVEYPEHIGITINEWLQDYKTTEEESNEEEKI